MSVLTYMTIYIPLSCISISHQANCVPGFVSCSGIPQSDLPPPPPSPINVTESSINATAPACMDAADQKIWTSKGAKSFESDMTTW